VAQQRPQESISERDLHNLELVERFEVLFQQAVGQSSLPPTFSNPQRKHQHGSYLGLFLLGLYNPVIKTMRALCAASKLARVQEVARGSQISLGTFSEMQSVVDPEILHRVFVDLAAQTTLEGTLPDARLKRLDLIAQDGSLWRALPRMTWADYGVGPDGEAKGVRLHLRLHLVRGVPCDAMVAQGISCERKALQQMSRPGQINVGDRYYGKSYALLRELDQAGSFFVFRLHDDAIINEEQVLPLTPEDKAAGVVRHVWATLGAHQSKRSPRLRVVEVRNRTHRLLLASNLSVSEAPADLVSAIYRRRWQIELFFRWIKCIFGNRHLFAESPEGVAIQMYLALIASLLLAMYTGKRPNQRQLETIQFYLMGWATEEELLRLLKEHEPKTRKKSLN
jgi:hypothetical protein